MKLAKKRKAKRKLKNYDSALAELSAIQNTDKSSLSLIPLDKQLLNIDDVARIFMVTKATIYKWKRLGVLLPTRFTRKLTFHVDDIKKFIAKKRLESKTKSS